MNGFEAELKRLLHANDWSFIRHGKGSHDIWHKDGIGNQTIPHGLQVQAAGK